jgi:hypothetical protein
MMMINYYAINVNMNINQLLNSNARTQDIILRLRNAVTKVIKNTESNSIKYASHEIDQFCLLKTPMGIAY